jgi:hypothetical protein
MLKEMFIISILYLIRVRGNLIELGVTFMGKYELHSEFS